MICFEVLLDGTAFSPVSEYEYGRVFWLAIRLRRVEQNIDRPTEHVNIDRNLRIVNIVLLCGAETLACVVLLFRLLYRFDLDICE